MFEPKRIAQREVEKRLLYPKGLKKNCLTVMVHNNTRIRLLPPEQNSGIIVSISPLGYQQYILDLMGSYNPINVVERMNVDKITALSDAISKDLETNISDF